MTTEDGIRFLAHEASFCRSHDEHEALCLLLPALLKALRLRPMDGYQAKVFRQRLKEALNATPALP